MLTLKDIRKDYGSGESAVHALSGVSLSFRRSEFVSILGPSGCGKTTLLNIIGGLDQYTSGDLVINGRSTKDFRDGDWDVYRNRAIGFVFQSYNLIPHQTVLRNVELAMTLSGVSRAERRRRAVEALERVGLGDQLRKKPNQMSGGQMQRVAIARALVNNPDIILADEPTGAIDTETSVQVMEILKEVARDRLVIMVTHNPDLAERYSTRIVRLLDGRVVDDTAPYGGEAETQTAPARIRKKPMSVRTAAGLSLNNLMTKKARTILTAFAGSIGIIGIALILSLSNGIQTYIDQVQEDTLSSYPIALEAESVDMTSMLTSLMSVPDADAPERERDTVYANAVLFQMLNSVNAAETTHNNLAAFREFLEREMNPDTATTELAAAVSAVQYGYDFDLGIYTEDPDGKIERSDLKAMMADLGTSMTGAESASSIAALLDSPMYSSMDQMKVWEELLPEGDGTGVNSLLTGQYDVVAGRWPERFDEVVLVVNERNELSDMALYTLGLASSEELYQTLMASMTGGEVAALSKTQWSFDELLSKTFRLILPAGRYQLDSATGAYVDIGESQTGLELLYEAGTPIRIVGIIRPNEDATATMMTGAIGYTHALTEYVMEKTAETDVVRAQLADPKTDVLSGLPFHDESAPEKTDAEKAAELRAHFAALGAADKAAIYTAVASEPSEEYLTQAVAAQTAGLDRAAAEQMLRQAYAAQTGADAASLESYFAQMDDETIMRYAEAAVAEMARAQYAEQMAAQLGAQTTDTLAALFDVAVGNAAPTAQTPAQPMTDAQMAALYETYMPATESTSTYDDVLTTLGYADPDSPDSIRLYAARFEDKDVIAAVIDAYNETAAEADQISYTDYVALLMSSVTTIINAISYVLIAFVAISLVVSSIMIGIITYISVLERTKEIGILRAIGASKKDIARVFNAETFLEGLVSGLLGIGLTLVLIVPMNIVIRRLSGIENIGAALPAAAAAVLVTISVLLTVVAGLIPSRIAARKDPVEALRTE